VHSWTKKICAILLCVCMAAGFLPLGAQAALVEDASPYLAQKMLLGDDLTFQLQGNINYYFAEHAVATLAYADRVDTYRLEDLTPVGDGQYAIAAELAAAQMTEDITLTIRVGEVEVLQETYSIRNYLSALLSGSFSEQTKQLCRELLNYGAWAQKYFGHRQDELANSGYEIEPQYPIAEEMPGVELSGSVSDVKFYGTSVRFTSKTAVRYYFTGSAENCSFTVDGVEYTPVSKDGMYYIEVPGVNPQDMETPMQVEVSDGTDTLSVRYVPLNFFVRSYQKATDETYRGLLQAAYSYFKTAATYTPEGNEDLGQSGGTEEAPDDVVPDSENLILGFESYAQITGAKIATGNMIGRMEINKDSRYISQGKASLKVVPQGDYSVPGKDPYFKLDLLDTTCATDDFSQFKSITFDVYNGQAETLHIRAGLVLGSDPNSYLTTIKQTIALNPNSWTTCSYDLSVVAGCGFYDLANVRYMTIAFAEHKQSKEDIPNVLYIDNLQGVPYGENEGPAPVEFGMETGLDFETYGHEYLFTGQGKASDAAVDRVRYYSAGVVRAPENGGSYGLRLSHESDYFPTFRIHFGKTLPADTQITFQAYGRLTSGTSQYNQSIFEFSAGGEATKQFACGQWTELTINLAEPAEYVDLFWNIDRAGITSTSASGEVYIDNIRAITPQPSGDFAQGIDFEQIGHAERFSGRDSAVTQRVLYTKTDVAAPTGGGLYALKASGEVNKQIPFRINFGRQLAAGTVVSFDAYGRITVTTGWAMTQNSQFKFASGSSAISSFDANKWKTVSFTLPETAEYVDLIWQYTCTGFGVKSTGEIFMDNFKAKEPVVPVGDFTEGVGFETSGNELRFTGIGEAQAATIERISYANANVTAPTNGGSYALKVSHASNCWPNFRMNFGKTLKAGTTITFDVYGNYDYAAAEGVTKYMKLELTGDSKNFATSADSNQVLWTVVDTWRTGVTITLTADSDHVDFFYNVADGQHGEVSSWILMDNAKAYEPSEVPVGDFTEGIDFETSGNELYFTGTGADQDAVVARVTYANAGVSYDNGGEYALKLSHNSHYYPTFQMNFGKTLPAGTVITFDAYGWFNGCQSSNEFNIEFTGNSGSGDVLWARPKTWTTATITLKSDCDHLQFFYNIERGNSISGDVASYLLIDNVKAVEPAVISGDITQGLDFEEEADTEFFAGQGMAQDATIERVTYANAGMTAPTDGGSYGLKLSHASNYWPTFRINFGKTLKAGTTITFWAYGKITSGTNLYNQSIFEFSSGSPGGSGEATAQFKCDQWVQLTITLSSDAEYINLFWNYDRANITSSTASGEVYLDNFLAVEPA